MDTHTLLLKAAGGGDRATVIEILDAKCDVNAVDAEGWSPLILASKAGDIGMVDYLLEHGAKPNPSAIAHTALRAASIFGHENVARRLLQANADPNFCSLFGRTPLMGAAMNNHPALVRLLLEAKADAGVRNEQGERALDLTSTAHSLTTDSAAEEKKNETLELLRAAALFEEARLGNSNALTESTLKSSVFNIELNGQTVLDIALEHGHRNLAAELISRGATRGCLSPDERFNRPETEVMPTRAHDGHLPLPSVLVLGGTQFIGRRTVDALLHAGYHVTIVTRGRSKNPFEHRELEHVVCDRLTERHRFQALVAQAVGEGCLGVIDFCAFQKNAVLDVVLGIGTSGAHYILISTDSVYMACLGPDAAPADGVREEQAVWPAETAEARLLRERDAYQSEYGTNKLAAELALAAVRQRTGLRYTCLRLPDVMGPYDNLGSFLRLQSLISTGMPVPVGPKRDSQGAIRSGSCGLRTRRISVVFVDDVASAIMAALKAGRSDAAAVHGESINIASAETPTFEEFVRALAEALDMADKLILDDDKACLGFPTVDFGPLSISKAQVLLGASGWKPTPLKDWVRTTVAWYKDGANAAYTMAFVRQNSMFG